MMQGPHFNGYGQYHPQFGGAKEWLLKKGLLAERGNKCASCGDTFKYAGEADFHHRNPEKKKIELNTVAMERHTEAEIRKEHATGEWLHRKCHEKAHKTNDPERFDPDYLKNKLAGRGAEDTRMARMRGKIKFGQLPPILATRMDMWGSKVKPPLAAQQELADWVWELYDKDMLSVHLPEPLEADMVDVKNRKRWASPAGWEKVAEEWDEFKAEVEAVTNCDKLDAFEIDNKLDKPLDRNQWELLLGALQWPYVPIERFLRYSVLKLDGRLRHQKANEGIAKEQRKAELRPYETQAAQYVFNVVA